MFFNDVGEAVAETDICYSSMITEFKKQKYFNYWNKN